MDSLARVFGADRGFIYNMSYVGLIYFFCYFWTAITFNPKDMAENLKDYGSFIPGYRPGARTAGYLESVMVRITFVGAAFLALVAVIPTIIAMSMGIDFLIASFYGGTGLLIGRPSRMLLTGRGWRRFRCWFRSSRTTPAQRRCARRARSWRSGKNRRW